MTQRLHLVIVLAAAAGCGTSDLTVAEANGDIASAICARILRCCSQDQIDCTAGHAIGESDCEELTALALRESIYLTDDAVDEGRRSVDEGAVRDCVDAIEALSCTTGSGLPDGCSEMFPGEQKIGDECLDSGECKSGTRCVVNGSDRQGICVPLQKEGEICFRHDQCDEGLYCSADGYVCHVRAVDGSRCEDPDDDVAAAPLCAEGLDCNDNERCQGPGDLGDPCDAGCREGLVCGAMDGTCMEPLPNGEACVYYGECESLFCDDTGECASDSTGCWMAYGLIGLDSCQP